MLTMWGLSQSAWNVSFYHIKFAKDTYIFITAELTGHIPVLLQCLLSRWITDRNIDMKALSDCKLCLTRYIRFETNYPRHGNRTSTQKHNTFFMFKFICHATSTVRHWHSIKIWHWTDKMLSSTSAYMCIHQHISQVLLCTLSSTQCIHVQTVTDGSLVCVQFNCM